MSQIHKLRRLLLLLICVFALAGLCHAQATVAADDDGVAAIHKKMADFAKSVKVFSKESQAKGEAKTKLVSKPIFRWTNPARKTDVGNIFL